MQTAINDPSFLTATQSLSLGRWHSSCCSSVSHLLMSLNDEEALYTGATYVEHGGCITKEIRWSKKTSMIIISCTVFTDLSKFLTLQHIINYYICFDLSTLELFNNNKFMLACHLMLQQLKICTGVKPTSFKKCGTFCANLTSLICVYPCIPSCISPKNKHP